MKLAVKSNFNKIKFLAFAAIAVGILGTTTMVFLKAQNNSSTRDITNQTVLVERKNWTMEIQANGVVQAVRKINLSPEDAGRVAVLYVKEGDRVSSGEIIARMSSDRLKAQVNQHRAILETARADLAEKLDGTRPEEIAAAKARVNTAKASVTAALAALARADEELQRNQAIAREGAISRNELGKYITARKQARAELEAARSRLIEQQEMLNRAIEGFRATEIASARANVRSARAQLAYYQTQLNDTIVRAPFAGTITRRFAEVGDFVTPTTSASESIGATSTSIAELSSGKEIEAKIPEANISKIYLDQNVEIEVDAYTNETFKAIVSLIAPTAVKENNVTFFRVKIALTTGVEKLKAGMNARLKFTSKPIENALVIPLAAIVTQTNGKTGVYVADAENQAKFQTIRVSAASGSQVQVLEGLKIGDRVFITPPDDLKIPGVDRVGS